MLITIGLNVNIKSERKEKIMKYKSKLKEVTA